MGGSAWLAAAVRPAPSWLRPTPARLLAAATWILALTAIGYLVAAATDGRMLDLRTWLAALTGVLFLTTLPIWAETTLSAAQLRSVPGFVLENSFGLWALGLIPVLFWIGVSPGKASSDDGEPALAGAKATVMMPDAHEYAALSTPADVAEPTGCTPTAAAGQGSPASLA